MLRKLERSLPTETDLTLKALLVVSCHRTDTKLVEAIAANGDELLKTESFKNTPKPVFQFVNPSSIWAF